MGVWDPDDEFDELEERVEMVRPRENGRRPEYEEPLNDIDGFGSIGDRLMRYGRSPWTTESMMVVAAFGAREQ